MQTATSSLSPGDHLTGIPSYRFKLGGEYQITAPWKVGADLNVIGSQWLVGDEANQNPKVPAYWVVNLNSSYKITQNLEVFGLVRNLFNKQYYVSGTFFELNFLPLFEFDRSPHLCSRHAICRLCGSAGYPAFRGSSIAANTDEGGGRPVGPALRRPLQIGPAFTSASTAATPSGVAPGLTA